MSPSFIRRITLFTVKANQTANTTTTTAATTVCCSSQRSISERHLLVKAMRISNFLTVNDRPYKFQTVNINPRQAFKPVDLISTSTAAARANNMAGEILVLPFHSLGHTFPATELCRRLASLGHRITIFLPPSSSSTSSQLHHPLITIAESSPPPPPPPHPQHHANTSDLENYLTSTEESSSSSPVLFAVVDVMMSHLVETCRKHGVPVVSFFTSSACSAAIEHGASKLSLEDMDLDDTVVIPGFPDGLVLKVGDLIRRGRPPISPPPPPAFDAAMATPIHGHGFQGPDSRTRPPPSFVPAHGLHSHPPPPPPPPFDPATATPIHGQGFHGPDGRPPPPGPPPSFASAHGSHSHPPPPPPPPFDAATGTPIHGHGFQGPDGGRLPPPGPPPSFSSVQSHPPPPKALDGQQGTDAGLSSKAPLGPGGGRPPQGIGETDGAIGLIFNTCDDLERPFLEYISKETSKPAWGVGPLLPGGFWESTGAPVHDQAVRSNHESSNVTEAEVLKWLDSKPPGSVLYISFGTLEGPSRDELVEIALALENVDRPFIWVLQTGPSRATTDPDPDSDSDPFGSSSRARERGLVIRGWAPQLLVLSHPSTGGFLSHCGWNSTAEAMACGVRMLTWPVKGDQFHNEKLVVEGLKVGRSIFRAAAPDMKVGREDVRVGVEEMMSDKEMEARAVRLRSLFATGFPKSSSRSLQSLVDFCRSN